MTLRVGVVTPNLDTGGSERQIVKLTAAMRGMDVEISVVILFGAYENPLLALLDPSVRVVRPKYFHHDPRIGRWLAGVIAENGFDIVHSFLWNADVYAAAAKKRATFALICSERGDRSRKTPLHAMLDRRLIFRRADLFCANSQFGARLLAQRGFDPQRIRVIPNGLDLVQVDAIERRDVRPLCGWEPGAPVAGVVSRLVDYKGVDVVLRAVAQVPGLHCAIIGTGPDERRLRRLARQLGATERIAFLGNQAAPEAFVKSFDVAALATRDAEHCSNAILEAMACAKPVVATNLGGNPELVADGTTGLLVPPGDVRAMAEAMRRLIGQPALREAMGAAARRRIEERFRIETAAREMLALWREAAS
ncbi:MAG TPA: glycosyltransferase family 4 protein [Thermoanaerobaculia bacterium]